MRRYETTFVVNPQADDAAIDQQVNAVADIVKSDGGKILNERRIGTRRLAYQIDGLVQGFYSCLIFDAETTVLPKLDRHYKLEEPYIRYLTIRYEGPLPSDEAPTLPDRDAERSGPRRPAQADKADKADKAEKVEKTEAPAPKVETEVKSDPEPVAEKPAVEEPKTEAPKTEAPKTEAPKAEEPAKPAKPAEPAKPADPADEEL